MSLMRLAVQFFTFFTEREQLFPLKVSDHHLARLYSPRGRLPLSETKSFKE